MKRVRAVVHGRVQGVGFRYFTAVQARKYGIGGFVKNRFDGTVELEAEGEPEQLDRFLEQVRQGPTYSHVSRVDITEILETGESGFSIRG